MYDYKQNNKSHIRQKILSNALDILTSDRQQSCCVSRKYVRQVANHFLQMDEEDPVYKETKKIQSTYLTAWEALYDSTVGYKVPSDLSVCYLSGPQPENDFNELVSLGVLPQNIWAFENDKATYLQAISTYCTNEFPQPRIIKMSIEQFFKQSPKKFDIVYIDACGTISSTQHALRCVATLFYHQRLNSPGVLITNFAKPNIKKDHIKKEFTTLISLYMVLKRMPNTQIISGDTLKIEGFDDIYKNINEDFEAYYGDFITNILSDLASVIIPLQRFGELALYSNLFSTAEITSITSQTNLSDINNIKNSSVCKWLLIIDWLKTHSHQFSSALNLNSFCGELIGIDGSWDKLIKGAKLFIALKCGSAGNISSINSIRNFFESNQNLYQFLDRPTASLFFDVVINQLTYPLHTNTKKCLSYQYCAKQTDMFTDLTIYDECRYLYEWLPAIHQIENAMKNISWQYIFRFAIDGLVKQRINYNNEFFFQGSVVPKDEIGFNAKMRKPREIIGG